jgi:cytochrome c-type biogenesis protein CcmH/NrfG
MGPQLQQAATLAARAAELDDSDPWAHLALGFAAFVRRQTNVAAAEFRRALERLTRIKSSPSHVQSGGFGDI